MYLCQTLCAETRHMKSRQKSKSNFIIFKASTGQVAWLVPTLVKECSLKTAVIIPVLVLAHCCLGLRGSSRCGVYDIFAMAYHAL